MEGQVELVYVKLPLCPPYPGNGRIFNLALLLIPAFVGDVQCINVMAHRWPAGWLEVGGRLNSEKLTKFHLALKDSKPSPRHIKEL